MYINKWYKLFTQSQIPKSVCLMHIYINMCVCVYNIKFRFVVFILSTRIILYIILIHKQPYARAVLIWQQCSIIVSIDTPSTAVIPVSVRCNYDFVKSSYIITTVRRSNTVEPVLRGRKYNNIRCTEHISNCTKTTVQC